MEARDTPEDRLLIAAARDGDERAFEDLYHRYRGYVLIVAARFGLSGDDALDVLQETFFYFFRTLPRFELRARFSTFLYPVVKNLTLKKKAKGSRLLSFSNGGIDIDALRAPEGAEDWRCRIIETVNTLPSQQREVVLLRFVDGMSLV